jgi:flavin-dependent dehydrogenase
MKTASTGIERADQSPETQTIDVAVIGGGIAGSSAAIRLARMGLGVTLFDKESGAHDKVCGEFISGEGLPLLREVGIDLEKNESPEITGFRLHSGNQTFSTTLPARARGISRRWLDNELLINAEKAGVKVERGTMVREIEEWPQKNRPYFVLNTKTETIRARYVIVATGKHDFKSVQVRSGRDSGYVGFKMHLHLKPSAAKRMAKHCDLYIFPYGYGGLSVIEDGVANFCFLMKRTALSKIGTDWESLAGHITKHSWAASQDLDGSTPLFKHCVSVARIPYGFIRSAPPPPGLFCVGDQMAVIPSLTGDGMTIAMMTAKRSCETIHRIELGEVPLKRATRMYQFEMAKALAPQVSAAFALHVLFRNPNLTSLMIPAIKRVPFIYRQAFRLTRCEIETGKNSKRLFGRKVPTLIES